MNNPLLRNGALLIARIGLGIVFVAHGWQKVVTNGFDATADGFKAMDVPMPTISAYYAGLVELVGGILLILGAATTIAAALLVVDMVGALLTVHVDKGIFVSEGGYEFVLTLALFSLLIAVFGAGAYSVDALLFRRRRTGRARTAV